MDIISSLPDPILCHILSFLPIHSSVKTSVLARRWRFLWTSVRNLHFYAGFDDDSYGNLCFDDREYYDSLSKNRMGFSDMVDRVLLLHNGSIDSLRIESDEKTFISEQQIDAWIRTAMAHRVHDFLLSDVWFPQFHYKCKNLVELTLKQCGISIESGAVCLPTLKKLHLFSNSYTNNQSFPNLVSGCSAIEDLVMERCMTMCDHMTCCYVCSPTLKSVVLEFELPCQLDHEHKLVLDIPAVQYLRIQDDTSQIIQAGKLSSLVEANIWFFNGYLEANTKRSRDMFQFIEKLSNAKSLIFASDDSMRLLYPTFSFATRRFHNLIDLDLEADWHVLTELLASANKLESLTIQKVNDELKRWTEPEQLPECLSSSLKFVSIYGFVGRKHELNMVRYILRHSKVLKTMNIYSVSHGNDSKFNMLKRISYFPRGSPRCRLTFV